MLKWKSLRSKPDMAGKPIEDEEKTCKMKDMQNNLSNNKPNKSRSLMNNIHNERLRYYATATLHAKQMAISFMGHSTPMSRAVQSCAGPWDKNKSRAPYSFTNCVQVQHLFNHLAKYNFVLYHPT